MTRWPYLFAAVAYMGVIFWFSSRPGDQVGIPPPWDKVVHTGVYALLGWLLHKGLNQPWWAWGIAVLFGISDEYHQRFTPGRFFDYGDWVCDSIGAAIGVWFGQHYSGFLR